MPVATAFLILAAFLIVFVTLALSDRRTLAARALLGLSAAGVVLGLGLFYASLIHAEERIEIGSRSSAGVQVPELKTAERIVRVEAAPRWAVRVLGAWVMLLAAGELLRLVLKRPAGAELVGPAVVLLGGLLLFDGGWAAALGFALVVVAVAALAAWRPVPPPGPPAVPSPDAAR